MQTKLIVFLWKWWNFVSISVNAPVQQLFLVVLECKDHYSMKWRSINENENSLFHSIPTIWGIMINEMQGLYCSI